MAYKCYYYSVHTLWLFLASKLTSLWLLLVDQILEDGSMDDDGDVNGVTMDDDDVLVKQEN